MKRSNENYREYLYMSVGLCNERLKSISEGSTRLTYTGLIGGLIETRSRGERFENVKISRRRTVV
jgi:hypothetical protein